MPSVYLSIGSNINRRRNIASAARALRKKFGDVLFSPVYQSRSVGFDGDDFYNFAACIQSERDPFEIQSALREIEDRHGRIRDGERFGSRVLDIDLLLYGDVCIDGPDLILPRPEIVEQPFVLKPLVDIAAQLQHPRTGKSMGDHWVEMLRIQPDSCELVSPKVGHAARV